MVDRGELLAESRFDRRRIRRQSPLADLSREVRSVAVEAREGVGDGSPVFGNVGITNITLIPLWPARLRPQRQPHIVAVMQPGCDLRVRLAKSIRSFRINHMAHSP